MMFARGGAVAEAMDSAAGADDFAADAAPSADSGAAAETSSSSDGEEFSGTNVQEEGVDEADTVKATADGFIYVAGTVLSPRGHVSDENRGDAAAATWIVPWRHESRRRRGCDVDISVET